MGKFEEDLSLPRSAISNSSNSNQNARCSTVSKFVRLKCVIVLLCSVAVFLSAIFWLPMFSHTDRADLDLESLIKVHDVVASFRLRVPVSVVKANIPQIELGIFEEIAVPNSTVVIIYVKALAESNTSTVVFAVVPNSKSLYISSASLSLLKSSFVSLVLRQSFLRLTSSTFGDPFFFEVLKLKGGISVIPLQNAFLLQKQIFFSFTLNFPIYRIHENFDELKNQLRTGLRLTEYENIYVSMNNSDGSTVAPPTVVQAAVLLAVGNHPPSLQRLKQLAQTITSPHARNLGLNHTIFGKVKQVQLTSVVQHSLDGAPSPSPGPMPQPSHRHHHHHHHHHHHNHHHHHHHHHHHRDVHLAPSAAPVKSYQAKPPSDYRNGFIGKDRRPPQLPPAVAPVFSPPHSASTKLPHVDNSPASAPHLPTSSPLPHVHPPNEDLPYVEAPNTTPSPSPMPSSSAGLLIWWPYPLVLLLLIHVL